LGFRSKSKELKKNIETNRGQAKRTDHIDAFFAGYADFDYDPSAPI
jgi:hypothetical protein